MDFARRGGGGGGKLRREGYNYCEVDDEQDDPATRHALHRPFNIASSSSSAAAAAAAESSSSSPSPSPSPSPSSQIQKEHMFDKVVTPSDVGKLNRLVIPKQHAEKYFPLDTTTHEKGLLLSFEDRTGKPWRFRYSYWNSSQSYVMTKGWSRFVKEKRLDAGDTVSFGRGVDDKNRLFIDWKRRPEIQDPSRGHHLPRIPLPLPPSNYHHGHHHHHPMVSFARSVGPWTGRILVPPAATVYDGHHQQNYVYDAVAGGGAPGEYHIFRSAVVQQPPGAVQLGISGFGSGGGGDQDGTVLGAAAAAPMVPESVPVVQTQAATGKRMRLFGVNLDLPDSDGDPGESSIRSQASGTFSSSSSPSPRGEEKQEPSLDLDM